MADAKAAGRKNALLLVKRGSAVSYMAVPIAVG
jgi:hypothetical protein